MAYIYRTFTHFYARYWAKDFTYSNSFNSYITYIKQV